MQEPVEVPSAQERDDPERFDPAESGGQLVDAEHQARYLLAQQFVSGRRVLDAACGTGYGTRILIDGGADEVTAMDIAPEAVEETRRRTRGEANVVKGDLYALPFDDDAFDIVVCFEAIEHVQQPEQVLAELR